MSACLITPELMETLVSNMSKDDMDRIIKSIKESKGYIAQTGVDDQQARALLQLFEDKVKASLSPQHLSDKRSEALPPPMLHVIVGMHSFHVPEKVLCVEGSVFTPSQRVYYFPNESPKNFEEVVGFLTKKIPKKLSSSEMATARNLGLFTPRDVTVHREKCDLSLVPHSCHFSSNGGGEVTDLMYPNEDTHWQNAYYTDTADPWIEIDFKGNYVIPTDATVYLDTNVGRKKNIFTLDVLGNALDGKGDYTTPVLTSGSNLYDSPVEFWNTIGSATNSNNEAVSVKVTLKRAPVPCTFVRFQFRDAKLKIKHVVLKGYAVVHQSDKQ